MTFRYLSDSSIKEGFNSLLWLFVDRSRTMSRGEVTFGLPGKWKKLVKWGVGVLLELFKQKCLIDTY